MVILRSASSKIVRNAFGAVCYQRNVSGYAFNVGCDREVETAFALYRRFSTDACKKQIVDDKLLQILKSEIKIKRFFLPTQLHLPYRGFPFKIKDEPCERNITLKREDFDGEKIDVVVVMPSNIPQDYEGDSDYFITYSTNYEDDDYDKDDSKSLTLKVTISKDNGKILEFEVSASFHQVKINSFQIKEPELPSHPLQIFGPHVVEEKGDLQLRLREFLKMRGIKKSICGYLYEYMLRKSREDHVATLKKLRKFVKE